MFPTLSSSKVTPQTTFNYWNKTLTPVNSHTSFSYFSSCELLPPYGLFAHRSIQFPPSQRHTHTKRVSFLRIKEVRTLTVDAWITALRGDSPIQCNWVQSRRDVCSSELTFIFGLTHRVVCITNHQWFPWFIRNQLGMNLACFKM